MKKETDLRVMQKLRVKPQKIEPVIVISKSQIPAVVSNFMPSSDAEIRKHLLEGMNRIKDRLALIEQYKSLDQSKFGQYKPIIPDVVASHWVDELITRRLGAKREDLLVVWNLKDGRHTFDPFTGEIKYGTT